MAPVCRAPGLMALLLALAAALMFPAPGQVTAGSISGYVLDPSGRPVAEANVTASDPARRVTREAVTDASGLYRVIELPPSAYEVIAAAPALEPVTVRGVAVAVNSAVRLDLHLPLAGRRDEVVVRASVQAIQAESAGLSSVLDRQMIQTLPLNRRDFLFLALLTAGVFAPVEDSQLSQLGSFAMHANGAREEHNNFLLDGVDNNDGYVNRYVVQPPVDSIREFKVVTNSYSAEYGRAAGGQVNVVTRGGGNQLHGFAYEYLRNRRLDARNFFDGASKAKLVRNQFGVGAGGAIVPNRAFVFAAVDFLRERRGLSRLATVPTAAERQGDLTALSKPVSDPFTRAPFPGNRIPASRISRIAPRVLDLFPLPDRPGGSGNYLAQPVLRETQTQTTARLDHHLSAKDQVTLRYSFGFLDLFEPYTEDTDAVPGFGDFVRDPAHNAMLHHQRVFGPRAVNSLRFGFTRFSREILPENHSTDAGRLWNVKWLDLPPRSLGFPVFNVAGYSRVGDTTSLPIFRHINTYQAADDLSLARGAHLLKLGADARHQRLASVLDLLARGSLSFSGALSGAGIGDLLLGLPSFGLQAASDNPITLRTTAYNLYAQEDWKVRPNFTLNLGLRYEYNIPAYDPTHRMPVFDFHSGAVVTAGTRGVSRSGIRPDRNNLAPRIGMAWNPSGNLALRAGYGVYFDSGMFIVNSAQFFNPPGFNLRVFFPTSTALLTLEDPFPTRGGFTPPPSLNVLSPDLTSSYLQHWSFSIQHPAAVLGTLSLAYGGSKGTYLIRSRDFNQPRPAPGDVQSRRPLRAYGNMLLVESGSNSSFHSLQAAFNRPLGGRLSLWAVYTLSKSIDDTSAFLSVKSDKNFPQDSQNFRAERAASSFDVRQRMALAYVCTLPGGNRWARNTEFRGITIVQTGQPFTPALRFDNSNTGNTGGSFGQDRPDLLGPAALPNPGADLWFNPGAFQVPARYNFGSGGRNIVRAAGLVTFDLSLARQFVLHERIKLSLEAQAFNLVNRTNLNLPELYADEPGRFGRVYSAKAPRLLQFALRIGF